MRTGPWEMPFPHICVGLRSGWPQKLVFVLFISENMQFIRSGNTECLLSTLEDIMAYYMSTPNVNMFFCLMCFIMCCLFLLYHYIIKNLLHQVILFLKRENIVYYKLNSTLNLKEIGSNVYQKHMYYSQYVIELQYENKSQDDLAARLQLIRK